MTALMHVAKGLSLPLDEETGYKRSSRDTYLQRLRSRRLVENVGPSEVRASEDLF